MDNSFLDQPEFEAGNLRIIPGKLQVLVGDQKVKDFTRNQFLILQTLAINPGQIFTRERLIEKLYGPDYVCTDRVIDQQIMSIRNRLKKYSPTEKYIETVPGIGYRFKE